MTPLITDALPWVSTGGMVAAAAVAVRYRNRAAQQRARADTLEERALTSERRVRAREDEAQHLAAARLPVLVEALRLGTQDQFEDQGLQHTTLKGSKADQAYRSVLQQVIDLSTHVSEHAEGVARASVQAVTRSVQALVYEQQAAITHLLETEHDEKLLELVQPVDHASSQLTRRLQVLGVLTGMWPGRQRDDAPLLEVVRGGVSRIRDYHRIQVPKDSGHYVAGRYVEPVVLALAELLDNAARHSPPSTPVEVSLLEAHRGISIQIHDAGPGMSPEAREEASRRLSGKHAHRLTELRTPPSFGHVGVGVLAAQYGFRASIDEEYSVHGGVRAVLHLPRELLAAPPAATDPRDEPEPVEPAPTSAEPTVVSEPSEYPVAADGLPVRRRQGPRRQGPRPATAQAPSASDSQALAAFVRGSRTAYPTEDEESPS